MYVITMTQAILIVSVEGQRRRVGTTMAAVDIDTASNDKDEPPVKYPLVVHYCGGSLSVL